MGLDQALLVGHSDTRDSPGETLFPQGLDGNAGDVHRHQTERELLEWRVKGQWSVSSGLVPRVAGRSTWLPLLLPTLCAKTLNCDLWLGI